MALVYQQDVDMSAADTYYIVADLRGVPRGPEIFRHAPSVTIQCTELTGSASWQVDDVDLRCARLPDDPPTRMLANHTNVAGVGSITAVDGIVGASWNYGSAGITDVLVVGVTTSGAATSAVCRVQVWW